MKDEMRRRKNWGRLLDTETLSKDIEAAASGAEEDTGWWRWKW